MIDVITNLVLTTGLGRDDLVRIVNTAPKRYKTFEIPKRNGGVREISQPARELKFIQRALVELLLRELPVHAAAKAYMPRTSIKDNANLHCGTGPILKMDFKYFFPSIKGNDWTRYCSDHNVLDRTNANITANIFFRKAKGEKHLKLSIGAPSSPILSNILMFEFDSILSGEAARRGINYSRYADDLTFSGQRIGMLKDMVKEVRLAIRKTRYPKLTVNEKKTVFITSASKRVVTGIVLANDGSTGIGREKRRLIRSQVHYALEQKLSQEELVNLCGQLAFVNVAEPDFLVRLEKTYGADLLKKIKHLPFT